MKNKIGIVDEDEPMKKRLRQGDRIRYITKSNGVWDITKPGIFLSYLKARKTTKELTEECLVYLDGNVSLSNVHINSIKRDE